MIHIIDIFGWICTCIILAGFILNSYAKHTHAIVAWIVGDIGWIIYDIYISNISHMALSAAIIGINIIGLHTISKRKMNESNNLD